MTASVLWSGAVVNDARVNGNADYVMRLSKTVENQNPRLFASTGFSLVAPMMGHKHLTCVFMLPASGVRCPLPRLKSWWQQHYIQFSAKSFAKVVESVN